MKTKLMLALAAAIMVAPGIYVHAADKAENAEASAAEAPTPEQLKARKNKKPLYVKISEAAPVAEKAGLPMLVAMMPERHVAAQFIEQKIIKRKEFLKDYAAKNFVLVLLRLKRDKEGKKVDTRPMKEAELKFLENFGLDERAVARAKQNNKPEPTYSDLSNYPAVICVSSDGQKLLFRMPPYDTEGGFGVWLSQVNDLFAAKAGVEPQISPLVQKILDNPDDQKKWK